MSMWQRWLFGGVLVAVALLAVGAFLDSSAVRVEHVEVQGVEWPSPFEREVFVVAPERDITVVRGDEHLWYFAGAAVLALTLAAVPLLRTRARRRPALGE